VTLYCPGVCEIYARGADHNFFFSAYTPWFDASAMTVLPHPWTPVSPRSASELTWSEKPPLTAGFVGSVYGNSTVARAASRSPALVRDYLLSGRYLRRPEALARLYQARVPMRFLAAFPRFGSLERLERENAARREIQLEIIDTGGFTGSEAQKESYYRHLLRTTYVMCPRGSENFSFRAFEAIKFGRVPVIIDTGMVLPHQVPWEEIGIVVPYAELDRLHQTIVNDYASRDCEAFQRRQQLCLEVAANLSSEVWLDEAIASVLA
jgi:hypothetical protein